MFGPGDPSIDENADGAIIATVSAVDPDAGETFTWQVDIPDFEVVELVPGVFTLKLVDGVSPNCEDNASIDVEVKVTDSEGAFFAKTVKVTVNDINGAPGGGGGLATWNPDDLQAGLRRAVLTPSPVIIDPEGDALSYELVTGPTSGTFYLGNTVVTVGTVLTQAQFDALTYFAPQAVGSYGVSFAVSDGVNSTALSVVLDVSAPVNDTLTGTNAANVLDGGAGNDQISGLNGNDRLFGGTGNDTLNGGSGIDTLNGDNGNDVLTGGAGADRLVGGAGIDFASYADETVGIIVSLGKPTVNTGVATGDIFIGIEGVIGGSGNDTINGGANYDQLIAGNGSDRLNGSLGLDTLTGGNGADRFVFTRALATRKVDTITGFVSGVDLLRGNRGIVSAAGPQVSADEFVAGSAALDANDRFVCNQTTGVLSYVADGNGAGAAVAIADLGMGTVMVFDDLRLF